MDLREIGCEDGNGSGSCLIVSFSISDIKPSSSAARMFGRFMPQYYLSEW